MGIYSRGTLIQTTSAGAASLEFNCNNTERLYLLSIQITLESAPGAASVFGFGQPGSPGQGQTWLTSGGPEDSAGLADVFPNIATAWSGIAPTVPANFFRRATLDNAVGCETIWKFPYGLIIPSASSFVLWNISAVGLAEVTLTWDD